MLVITGAAGFIGSCWWSYCLQKKQYNLLVVDDFSLLYKQKNWQQKSFQLQMQRDLFLTWLAQPQNAKTVDFVVHLGARTDTAEKDIAVFDLLNLHYSQQLFRLCTEFQIPIIYASSAATYGLGENGYDDRTLPSSLHPLNPYGDSKNDFDAWVLQQSSFPPFWAGLKFFNVYGPNEYHKSRMASVIWHAFRQIQETQAMRLFRSHHPDYRDGEQMRDFIYVLDILKIIDFLYTQRPQSGIYNAGTGQARSFLDLVLNTFSAMQIPSNTSFIDTPSDIRDTYQYYTQADMSKLLAIGYKEPFYSLEAGVEDYVQRFLLNGTKIF